MASCRPCLCLITLVARLLNAVGLLIEGELPVSEDFSTYLGKFCFDFDPTNATSSGDVDFRIFPVDPMYSFNGRKVPDRELVFALYDDSRKHWKIARREWETSTCEQKLALASLVERVPIKGQLDSMSDTIASTYWLHVKEHIRPRWWYFTLLTCGKPLTEKMRFRLHLNQTHHGWQAEFSWDELEQLPLHCGFCLGFLIVWLACVCCLQSRAGGGDDIREHPLVRLLLLSHVSAVLSSGFFVTYYAVYQQIGRLLWRVRFLGVVGELISTSTVCIVVLLVAHRWGIGRAKFRSKRIFFGTVTILCGLICYCEIGSEVLVDQSTKLYRYQSFSGLMVVLCKIVMFLWFFRSCFGTITTLPRTCSVEEPLFFRILLLTFSIWFLTAPAAMIVAYAFNPWYRMCVVSMFDLFSRLFGQLVLTWLLCGNLSPISKAHTLSALLDADGELEARVPSLSTSTFDNGDADMCHSVELRHVSQ